MAACNITPMTSNIALLVKQVRDSKQIITNDASLQLCSMIDITYILPSKFSQVVGKIYLCWTCLVNVQLISSRVWWSCNSSAIIALGMATAAREVTTDVMKHLAIVEKAGGDSFH